MGAFSPPETGPTFIELDDGKFYRKPLYLMVKTMVSCRFSQENQSIDTCEVHLIRPSFRAPLV